MEGDVRRFSRYLLLEKAVSRNTIDAYLRDVGKLLDYFADRDIRYLDARLPDFQDFLLALSDVGISSRSQARIISGIKSFYGFLLLNDQIEENPTELLELPRIGHRLPSVLTVEEIDAIESAIDLSKPEGHRNKAMIETAYSCGLRVSELVGLKMSNIYWDDRYILIEGKGSKQRLVPVSDTAVKMIRLYLPDRNAIEPKSGCEDILFLNRRGGKLSRQMVFLFLKEYALKAGVTTELSPHTLRHSFATHLLEGGANLRVIQEMLGHESIITTEVYTHITADYLRSAIADYHPRGNKK